jgi:hypothetical protein
MELYLHSDTSLTVYCITTHGNFDLLSDALDEIISLMVLAEEIILNLMTTTMMMIQFMFIDLSSEQPDGQL